MRVGGFRGLGCVALGCGWVGVWRVGGFGVRERESVGLEQKLVSPWTHMGGLGWVALGGLGWNRNSPWSHMAPRQGGALAMFVEGCDVKAIAMTLT